MKKMLSLLIIITLALACVPAHAEADSILFGEWIHYASSFEGLFTTRADESAPYGFEIRRDGGVSFLRNGVSIDEGSWTWDDEREIVTLADSTGVEMMLVMINGMLHTVNHYEGMDSLEIYYRPELYAASSEYFYGSAWKLTNFVIDGKAAPAKQNKSEYLFCLHDDGSASLLVNCLPQKGEWRTGGFKVLIESDAGTCMELEPQYDGTLFGLYYGPDGMTLQLEFEETEPFRLEEPGITLESLGGTWGLTAVVDPYQTYYSKEELSFDFTLTLDGETAGMHYVATNIDDLIPLTASLLGGAKLQEDDAGSILSLMRPNGSSMAFWLKTDGSLHWKNPGDSTYIFEKMQ